MYIYCEIAFLIAPSVFTSQAIESLSPHLSQKRTRLLSDTCIALSIPPQYGSWIRMKPLSKLSASISFLEGFFPPPIITRISPSSFCRITGGIEQAGAPMILPFSVLRSYRYYPPQILNRQYMILSIFYVAALTLQLH